jgi:chromosomal replication initiator protein
METAISMASALRKEIAPNVSDDDIRSLIASFPEAELTAAFVRVVVTSAAASVSSNGELDLKRAAVLAKSNVQAPAVGIKDIAKLVSRRMNIRLTDLRSSTRQARVVRARGVVTLLVRDTTNLSLQEIGEYLGGRDHSTVLHSYNKTVKLLSTDPEISALHTQLLSELSS